MRACIGARKRISAVLSATAAALVLLHGDGAAAQELSTRTDPLSPLLPLPPGLRWPTDGQSGNGALRFPATMLAQSNMAAPATGATASEFGADKSYVIPALDILGFDFLLNRFNHQFSGRNDYDVTGATIRRNFRGGWVTDNDPFNVNQFGHPYQGSMYHGFARSAGLGYWEASAYTFVGSAAWEIAGERTRPSKNDQVASGIAGSFLGEALFRMASLVLEHGDGVPSFWRELIAGSISPSTGFNRLAFGSRFDPIFSSHDAPYYSRLQIGYSYTVQRAQGAPSDINRNQALADFSLQYGLPGKQGYEYTRPFDYFTFDATATTQDVFENFRTRGMLVGAPFGHGEESYRGIWGLFGSYDYIAPQTYRISTTALSLGSTVQWWLSQTIALQSSALLGLGYAAVGATRSHSDQDYNYGVAPQAVLAARLIFDDRSALDATAWGYFVHGVGRGNDRIARADISYTVRVYKQHGIALKYLWNRRDTNTIILGSSAQTNATVGLFWTYLGKDAFGAIDWR